MSFLKKCKTWILDFWNSSYCKIVLLSLLLTITFPSLCSSVGMNRPFKIGLIFIVFNVFISAIMAHWVKKYDKSKWAYLIYPGAFLLLVLTEYTTSPYMYCFTLLYLLVEYLTSLLTKKN